MKKHPLFITNHLSFTYDTSTVLSDISVTIFEGERVAILGANGSGKSSLLKIFDALQFPTSGSIKYKDNQLNEAYFSVREREYAFRREVGFVFQDPDVQLFNQTVLDEIRFGPLHMGLTRDEIDARVEYALDMVRINHLSNRSPFTLSGGEKKRVSLASILSMKPKVWLMDEPLASLDPRSQSTVIDFLLDAKNRGETSIITSHDVLMLHELADRVLVLSEDHTLVSDSTPEQLLKQRDFLIHHNLMHNHVHDHGSKTHVHKHIHESIHTH